MLLQFDNVTKIYKSSTTKALDNFSTEIRSGEVVGLIGKNGSGKTTLMNCLTNNIHLTSGKILYKGKNLMENINEISEFGVLIESSFVDYLNAYQNLELLLIAEGLSNKEEIKEEIERVLNLVGLLNRKHDYVKSYSFGMKQRLGLAQALLRDKRVLILDEPLVGLDVIGRNLVKNLIVDLAKKEGKAIIFSDHNLSEVKDVCDRIIYIENGVKVFDDVFDDNKRYIVEIDERSQIFESENYQRTEDNFIVVKQKEQLNEVITQIVQQGIPIVDIKVNESSLMELFKGE
ncbi:ABC transporter ATP-binding protein [Lysinibacillus xylanilyticus]|uniref:ABC transporter ATP-binding protein n=1 Tax=Lysinibacillus xylanilyticus TaxID=582475 RepID=UPI003D030365